MILQYRLDDFALDADPPAVDDADLPKTALEGLMQILLYDYRNFTRLKGVKVDRVLDRDFVHKSSI